MAYRLTYIIYYLNHSYINKMGVIGYYLLTITTLFKRLWQCVSACHLQPATLFETPSLTAEKVTAARRLRSNRGKGMCWPKKVLETERGVRDANGKGRELVSKDLM